MPDISQNCTNQITCDLHYEPDWSYRLRAEINCNQVVEKDPCFATYACICDNNYFQIASLMPEVPQEY